MYKILFICLMFLASSSALAQHSIDVQRYAAQGEFFKALAEFEKLPKRKVNTEASLAAAKSAWALGLPDKSLEYYEDALKRGNLNEDARAGIILSEGIIHYQEGRNELAEVNASKAIKMLDNGIVKSRAFVLWGEVLMKLGKDGAAEEKFQNALSLSPDREKPEIFFLMGRAQMKVGRFKEAEASFKSIDVTSDRLPEALRYLSLISLEQGNYEATRFWLTKAMKEYPDMFLDSWVDYAMMEVFTNLKETDNVKKLLTTTTEKYPPSDHWYTLLQSAGESYLWKTQDKAV
mgnify:CR=1 FL=1